MIVSFHPIIDGDINLICAGRPPGDEERCAATEAEAIIVPQGVREDLYRLCRASCPLVWPNLDARFDYPGKVGQTRWFAELGLPMPRTVIFHTVSDYRRRDGGASRYPFVLKTDQGGEGAGVFVIRDPDAEKQALEWLEQNERLDRGGFIWQEMVNHHSRDLRVAVIGESLTAYWRVAERPGRTLTNLAAGSRIEFDGYPDLMAEGRARVEDFVEKAGIDLAGIDILFDFRETSPRPLFLEINFFFGRRGLGGTDNYYKLLKKAARSWLKKQGLKVNSRRTRRRYSRRD